MAERRMFAKTVIDSDAFLDMPLSTQALYFHLAMRADDDGFVNNPKKVQRMVGCADDDLKLLTAKNFIIPFESGVVVIKHWKIHNYIRNDRYKETVYQEEKAMLNTKENNAYTLGIPNGYQMDTQDRLGKVSIELGKDRLELDCPSDKPKRATKKKYGEYGWVKLTDEQYTRLCDEYGDDKIAERIQYVDEYVQSNGNKNKYSDWNLVIRRAIRENWGGKRDAQIAQEERDPFLAYMEEQSRKEVF